MKLLFNTLFALSLVLLLSESCIAQEFGPPHPARLAGEIAVGAKEPADWSQPVVDNSTVLFDALSKNRPPITKPGITNKAVSKFVSLGNFMFDLRGFDWSIEGADVALGEKLDYKSEISREYAIRRKHDRRELDTICTIFQTAMVNGLSKTAKRDELLAASEAKLIGLIGDSNVKNLNDRLNRLNQEPTLPLLGQEQTGEAATWTVDEQQEKFNAIVEKAIEKDEQIKDVLTRLHKFNGKSKFARISAKMVYTTLGLASFAPTFVAPAAEASLLAFMTATGGPEQDKLLREMYLCKCLESRYKTINEEAHLAVTNAQVAALTNNRTLAACSLGLVAHMAGPEMVANVFPSSADKQLASKLMKPPANEATSAEGDRLLDTTD